MYKVSNTLSSAYGPEVMDFRQKQGPVRFYIFKGAAIVGIKDY